MWLLGPFRRETRAGRLLGLLGVLATVLVGQLVAIAVWLGLGVRSDEHQLPKQLGVTALVWLFLWAVVLPAAGAASGRVALPCSPWTGSLRPHSVMYCVLGRNYVRRPLADAVQVAASDLHGQDATFVVRYLDGGFPVGLGFPLLPHLSHGDGRRLDLMLQYAQSDGSPASGNGSPIGYWGYVASTDAPACPARWTDLRWDFGPLQFVLSRHRLDQTRSRRLLQRILADGRIGKVLIEPHLKRTLGVGDERLRFQGCRAARHDDHIHVQL